MDAFDIFQLLDLQQLLHETGAMVIHRVTEKFSPLPGTTQQACGEAGIQTQKSWL